MCLAADEMPDPLDEGLGGGGVNDSFPPTDVPVPPTTRKRPGGGCCCGGGDVEAPERPAGACHGSEEIAQAPAYLDEYGFESGRAAAQPPTKRPKCNCAGERGAGCGCGPNCRCLTSDVEFASRTMMELNSLFARESQAANASGALGVRGGGVGEEAGVEAAAAGEDDDDGSGGCVCMPASPPAVPEGHVVGRSSEMQPYNYFPLLSDDAAPNDADLDELVSRGVVATDTGTVSGLGLGTGHSIEEMALGNTPTEEKVGSKSWSLGTTPSTVGTPVVVNGNLVLLHQSGVGNGNGIGNVHTAVSEKAKAPPVQKSCCGGSTATPSSAAWSFATEVSTVVTPSSAGSVNESASADGTPVKSERPYSCLEAGCSSRFVFKQNRDRHMIEVHQPERRPFSCKHRNCGAAFKNSSGLKQHESTVHQKNRPFKCDKCEASFGQRNHLTQHTRAVHLGARPFACTVCEAKFSNRGNLNQHIRRRKHAPTAAPVVT